MDAWKSFEKECCDYLNRAYGNERVQFVWDGGSDSTSPDIMVFINGRNAFNIEVKSPQAQSGQFVVLNENDEMTRMFLKGCIATANALAGRCRE